MFHRDAAARCVKRGNRDNRHALPSRERNRHSLEARKIKFFMRRGRNTSAVLRCDGDKPGASRNLHSSSGDGSSA
jgi:hypothetical protein